MTTYFLCVQFNVIFWSVPMFHKWSLMRQLWTNKFFAYQAWCWEGFATQSVCWNMYDSALTFHSWAPSSDGLMQAGNTATHRQAPVGGTHHRPQPASRHEGLSFVQGPQITISQSSVQRRVTHQRVTTNAQHFLLASQICVKLVLPRNPSKSKIVKNGEPSLWTAKQFVTHPSLIPCHCFGKCIVLFYTFAHWLRKGPLFPPLH